MKLHKCGMMERGIHIANGTIGPCSMLPTVGVYRTPEEYWYSEEHKVFKEAFYNGDYHPTCQSCLDDPEFNLSSALPDWGLQVTYGASSKCTFACRSCRHSNHTERNLLKDNPELHKLHQFETGESTPEQLQWVLDNIKKTSRFDFFGGDPVLAPETELILDELEKHPDCLVYFNYNGYSLKFPSGEYIYDRLARIKNLEFSCSIDATHEDFERLRPGPRFERVKANILTVREKMPDTKFSLGLTITNQNIVNFVEFADRLTYAFKPYLFDYYLIVGYTPEYLAPWELPYSVKVRLKQEFKSRIDDPHWGRYYKYFIKLLNRKRLPMGDLVIERFKV